MLRTKFATGTDVDADDGMIAYEQGLHLCAPDTTEEVRWQDRAACHGLYYLYDLDDLDTLPSGTAVRLVNRYRTNAARDICYECPVYMECWNTAMVELPRAVIQAGARLYSGFAARREQALLEALAGYYDHREHHERRERRLALHH